MNRDGSGTGAQPPWEQLLSAPNSSPQRTRPRNTKAFFERREKTAHKRTNQERTSPYNNTYSRFEKQSDSQSDFQSHQSKPKPTRTAHKSSKQVDCSFCLDSSKCLNYRQNTFMAASDHIYLAAQLTKDALVPYHMLICPVTHVATSCQLSYEAQRDIQKFKKSITSFLADLASPVFAECGYQAASFKPIFVEWNLWSKSGWMRSAIQASGSGPHVTVDVLPLSREDHADAIKIVARELQLIGADLTRKNKGLRRVESGVPLSSLINVNEPPKYIYIDFGEEAFLLTLEEDERDDVNLTERIDRKFMRSLLKSLYPDELITMSEAGLNEMNYYVAMRNSFTKYDFNNDQS